MGYKKTDDNMTTYDALEVILGLCEGEIKGLSNGLKSLYFDQTPLMAADGTDNFSSTEAKLSWGAAGDNFAQPRLGGFTSGVNEVGVELKQNTAVSSTLNTQNQDFLDIRFQVNQLYRSDKKGTYSDKIELKIELQPTLGPLAGAYQNVTEGEIATTIPADSTGGFEGSEEGSVYSQMVTYLSQTLVEEANSSASSSPVFTIKGKTTSAVTRELRINVPKTDDYANTGWTVRITLMNDENVQTDDGETIRNIVWESIQGVAAVGYNLENLAFLQVITQTTDQLQGAPNIWGIYDTSLVKVPPIEVYHPITRQYTGVLWDGSYSLGFTNDPAYIIQDIIEDDVSGLSSYIGMNINKWDVLEASKWYSELVPDGKGGTEPRYSFDYAFTDARTGSEAYQFVASTVNSIIFEDLNGEMRLKADKEEPAVMLFTHENIFEDFEYSHTDTTTRINDVTVVYKDPDLLYKDNRVRVFDQDQINKYGRIPNEVGAPDCTSRQEALRRGYHRLLSSTQETRMVVFKTNRVAGHLQLFQTILIADRDLGIGEHGRVLAQSGTTLTLRDPIYLEDGVDYELSFSIPNPDYNEEITLESTVEGYENKTMIITRAITNSNGAQRGSVTELYIDSILPANCPENVTFALSDTTNGVAPKAYRVIELSNTTDPDIYQVTAIEVFRNKYSLVDNVVESQIASTVTETTIPPIKSPSLTEVQYGDQFDTSVIVGLSWERPDSSFVYAYEVQMSTDEGPWQTLYTSLYATRFELPVTKQAKYKFRVQSLSARGGKSEAVEVDYTEAEQANTTSAVTNIILKDEPNGATTFFSENPVFQWESNLNTFFKHHRVRIYDGATVVREDFTRDKEYIYTINNNKDDNGGTARRSFDVGVAQVDTYGAVGVEVKKSVSNPLPLAPTGSIAATDKTVLLDLNQSADNDFSRFIVKDNSNNTVFTGPDTAITIPGLTPNTAYIFHVFAVDKLGGQSSNGVTLNVTTLVDPTTAVTYSNIDGTPTTLADINSTEGDKLEGIEDGATATGVNLSTLPHGAEFEGTGGGGVRWNAAISDMGLDVGDTVSLRITARSGDGVTNWRPVIKFIDGNGADISGFFEGSALTNTTYLTQDILAKVIPANTVTIQFGADAGSVGSVWSKNPMLVKGPKAVDYTPYSDRTDYDAIASTYVNAVTHSNDLAGLQSQIDGNIASWFYDGLPTLLNAPYSTWADDTERDKHIGDTYTDKLTGNSYRFIKDGAVYSWWQITDTDTTAALQAAADAQDTADGKRRVFVATPTGPYDIGDLWDTGAGIKRATAGRADGDGYLASEWVLIGDVTVDAFANLSLADLDADKDGLIDEGINAAIPAGVAVGGFGTVEIIPNSTSSGANNGEFFIKAGRIIHPVTSSVITIYNDTYANTPFEGGVTGRFFLFYSAQLTTDRFVGFIDAGTYFFAATYDWSTKVWTAYNNAGTAFPFTPVSTDLILGTAENFNAAGGFDNWNSYYIYHAGMAAEGADVTSQNTAADVTSIAGTPAWTVRDDAGEARGLTDAHLSRIVGGSIANILSGTHEDKWLRISTVVAAAGRKSYKLKIACGGGGLYPAKWQADITQISSKVTVKWSGGSGWNATKRMRFITDGNTIHVDVQHKGHPTVGAILEVELVPDGTVDYGSTLACPMTFDVAVDAGYSNLLEFATVGGSGFKSNIGAIDFFDTDNTEDFTNNQMRISSDGGNIYMSRQNALGATVSVDSEPVSNINALLLANAPAEAGATNTTNTNQLTDGAGLGDTADWPSVIGVGRPADNANNVNLISDATLGRISYQINGGATQTYEAVSQSQIDTRADSRVSTLRPDTTYKNTNVTYGGLGDKPTSLGAINSGEGTKLTGIETGATASAVNLFTTETLSEPTTTGSGNLWWNQYDIDTLGISEGDLVSLSLAVKFSGGKGGDVKCGFFDSGGSLIGSYTNIVIGVSPSVWTTYSIEAVGVPIGAVRIALFCDCDTTAGTAWARHPMLVKGAKIAPFVTVRADVAEGADVTSANTANDTLNVAGVSGSTVKGGAVKANTALDANSKLQTGISQVRVLPMQQAASVGSLIENATGYPNILSSTNISIGSSSIDVAAFTLRLGDENISYSAGSTSAGLPNAWYHVYVSDPTYAGGSVTYVKTAVRSGAFGDGYLYLGAIKTAAYDAPPTSGTGTGSSDPVYTNPADGNPIP